MYPQLQDTLGWKCSGGCGTACQEIPSPHSGKAPYTLEPVGKLEPFLPRQSRCVAQQCHGLLLHNAHGSDQCYLKSPHFPAWKRCIEVKSPNQTQSSAPNVECFSNIAEKQTILQLWKETLKNAASSRRICPAAFLLHPIHPSTLPAAAGDGDQHKNMLLLFQSLPSEKLEAIHS